jgi:hypothetical protein
MSEEKSFERTKKNIIGRGITKKPEDINNVNNKKMRRKYQ